MTEERYKYPSKINHTYREGDPALVARHWYVAIEPDSEEYFIDRDPDSARQKAREKYPDRLTCTFGFNETGSCGKIRSRELSGVRDNFGFKRF